MELGIPQIYRAKIFLFLHSNLNFIFGKFRGKSLKNIKDRIRWEDQFEKSIQTMISNEEELDIKMGKYQQLSHSYRREEKENISNNNANLIDEADRPQRGLTYLFRFIDLSSSNSLYDIMQNESNQKSFPYLATYLVVEEDLKTFRGVYNILKFSQMALDNFNYRISREEARKLKIEEAFTKYKTPLLKSAFKAFQDGWGLYYENRKESIRFGCQDLPEIKNISLDSELAYILADTVDKGFGMYMAAFIEEVITKQNTILKILNNKIGQRFIQNCEIQNLKSSDIFDDSQFKGLNSFLLEPVENYSYFELEYGKGRTRMYNLTLLDEEIHQKIFSRKKMINDRDLNYVKYHFEVVKESRLIDNLRSRVPQSNLTKIELAVLTDAFRLVDTETFFDFYKSMNTIIYLANIDIFLKSDTEISNVLKKYIDNWDINKKLGDIISKTQLKVNKLEALFDLIEFKSYKEIEVRVPFDYKSNLPIGLKIEPFLKEIKERKGTLNIEHLTNAIRRLISRYLIVTNWEKTKKLVDFIMYNDIWDSNVASDENIDVYDCWLITQFPKGLLLTHTVSLYEYLIRKK
jgi:hypothetical protein